MTSFKISFLLIYSNLIKMFLAILCMCVFIFVVFTELLDLQIYSFCQIWEEKNQALFLQIGPPHSSGASNCTNIKPLDIAPQVTEIVFIS